MTVHQAPRLFYFNPTCEMEVANGSPNYMPPAQVTHLLNDGACIPIYFCEQDDRVVVEKLPSPEFRQGLAQLGIGEEAFLTHGDLNRLPGRYQFTPWGASPSVLKRFEGYVPDQKKWNEHAQLKYRRETALRVLQQVAIYDFTLDERLFPKVCKDILQVEVLLAQWGQVVLKAPMSSSGRGIQFLRKPALNDSIRQWIHSVLAQQESIMCEPLLSRRFDFSLHYYKTAGSCHFIGESACVNNSNGKYLGNEIGNILDFKGVSKDQVMRIRHALENAIQTDLAFQTYEGPVGVDLFSFEDQGRFKLQPCVEINARHSMGYVSLRLQNFVAENSRGVFRSYFKKQVSSSNFFLETTGDKIARCRWPLSDYWNAKKFVFVLEIEEN